MSAKLFVSYSHKDEEFMKRFETHLAGLARSGDVAVWHDRKISPSRDWEGEIHSELESSDLMILLISSDFIASDYCHDVEMNRALERHKDGKSILVPVIIRSCDWKSLEISKVQALPKDAIAVASWSDEDEAWMNVISGIRDVLRSDCEGGSQKALIADVTLSEETKAWILDTEVKLSHRRVDNVTLPDIYVEPDFRSLDNEVDPESLRDTVSCREVISQNTCSIVFGDEQIGKTAFLKYAFNEYYRKGLYPVYIKGEKIKTANIDGLVNEAFNTQYITPNLAQIKKENIVILVDDIQNHRLNVRYFDKFVEACSSQYYLALFSAQESYQYVCPEYEALDKFNEYELVGFGNLNRYKLIKIWLSLGIEQTIEDGELYEQCDESKDRLDSVIRKNIVPSKPIYLISLLQMFEAYRPQELELTSYGHCYQHLIYQALERANIKAKDIEKYINVLSELSFWIYKNGNYGIDKFELKEFFDFYEKDYILGPRDRESIIENLLNHSILINRQGRFSFKYPYIYYFFVAKRIADSLSVDDSTSEEISALLNNLHKEDASNILIFITHHTKDDRVLAEIQSSLFSLFENEQEATLSKESLKFMEEFLKEIPDLVIEHKKGEDHRESEHSKKDEFEHQNKEMDKRIEELEPSDVLAKINKAFKGMELIGQIVRNRHASMKKDVIKDLVSDGYGAGLRFLSFFLSLSDVSKDEVIKTIEYALQERPNIANEDVEKLARNTFLHLTYGVINGVVRKIGSSLGSKEAAQIYDLIEKERDTPAVKLVNQGMKLSFSKRIDVDDIGKMKDEFQSNPTCLRILKELVVEHLYMFPSDYKDKQRISETLGIPMKSQRAMQMQKKFRI